MVELSGGHQKRAQGESSRQHCVSGDFIAKAYSGLDDHQAFDWLENAYSERTNSVPADYKQFSCSVRFRTIQTAVLDFFILSKGDQPMKLWVLCPFILLLLIQPYGSFGDDRCRILPTPQFYEYLNDKIIVSPGQIKLNYVVPSPVEPPIRVAMDLISETFEEFGIKVNASQSAVGEPISQAGLNIFLLPYARYSEGRSRDPILNEEDRQTLRSRDASGQQYVLVVQSRSRSINLIGGTSQGVLYAAASLVQLIVREGAVVAIPAVHVRDFPDFKYRMAADWLMNVEINRWSYDWGDGIKGYSERMKRKLDLCTRYKINMVLAHGFGWDTDFFPGFAEMMRGLSEYARDRGIRMVTGGYGASYGIAYQSGPLYEEAPYLGKVFKNRVSYPDGQIYQCMGFSDAKDPSIDTRTLGSCRANEELNGLKAAELRDYVEKTEPGGLYIHHEDFGGYDGTQGSWLQRCERCRRRWPNDDLKALDGGAGGLANGYGRLIDAINGVRNPKTGYDASRDCTIVLVSPVYQTDSLSEKDWDNVLLLWQNIGRQLPRSENVEIGFREIFPLRGSTRKWALDFNHTMSAAKLPFGIFMFFAGGADYYLSDYPVVASPTLNHAFLGSEAIFNASGGFNQEPMQLIDAEYSWNSRSNGFFHDPNTYEDGVRFWKSYIENETRPDKIFGPDGLLERVCESLYGRNAGRMVAKVHTTFEVADRKETPPGMWPKLYPMGVLWRNLAQDSKGWSRNIADSNLKQFLNKNGLDSLSYHRNMISRWAKWEQLSNYGLRCLEAALMDSDLRPAVRLDVDYLRQTISVGARFSELLKSLHAFLASDEKTVESLRQSLKKESAELEAHIHTSFGTQLIDPSGGDIRSWLIALKKINSLLSPP